jgi:hypothetical protein
MSSRGQGGRKRSSSSSRSGGSDSEFVAAARAAGLDVQPGKKALKGEYRDAVEANPRSSFTGSADLDAAFQPSEPQAARWDYCLGVSSDQEKLFWIEPHPASSTSEVPKMLAKLDWLKAKLAQPAFASLLSLTNRTRADGSIVYLWLCSGANRITPNSREALMLARNGLSLPRRHLILP